MYTALMIGLTILAVWSTWRFYRWIGRMSNRSVASTEATAAVLENMQQTMFDALTPEAKYRVAEAREQRLIAHETARRATLKRQAWNGLYRALFVFGILFVLFAIHAMR
jgi:hypothetical protein